MKEIDDGIRTALRDAALDCGSVLKLSKMFGVSHSTVLFWGSGRTRRIDGDVWRYKVFPVLERYLRRGGVWARLDSGAVDSYGRLGVGLAAASLHEVPVVGLAQATGFDPALEPFEAYARGCGEETAFFAMAPKSGHFALRIEGRSMEPEFPDGTLILVAGGEFVESGDIVVARIRENGQVVVKRLQSMGARMRLESLNGSGLCYEWDRNSERGFLEWMHPVVEAKVDLRAKRLAYDGLRQASGMPVDVCFKDEGLKVAVVD